MSTTFTETEKDRVRHHLGYLLTTPVTSIVMGFPRATQPMFLVESALNNVPEHAANQIRQYIAVLDGIEAKLVEAQDYMVAERLGEITIREDHADKLEREYARWARRLADDLGVPLNAYSERFRAGGISPLNLSVVQ